MKKIYPLFIIFLLSVGIVYSQSWRSSYQLQGTSDLSVIEASSDALNNTYIFGYFNGAITISETEQIDSRGGRDLFLAKFDTSSNLLWIRGLGGSLNEFFDGGMFISSDDNIFLTGSFQSDFYYTDTDFITSGGSHDVFLAKFSLDGDAIWCRNVGTGLDYQRSTAIRGDSEDNILLAGYFNDSITIDGDTTVYEFNNFKDYYISKFEPEYGDFQWMKSYQSISSDYSGFIYSIRATGNNYYLSGVFGDSIRIDNDTIVPETLGYYDTHLLKTDTSGNEEWTRLIKGYWHDYSYNSIMDAAENIYITGYFNSPTLTIDSTETTTIVRPSAGAGYDFFIASYDSLGNLRWININGGDGEDRLLHAEIFNNELHVTGYFADAITWGGTQLTTNGFDDQDMFIGSMDLDGNYRSANSFGGINNSTEAGIAVFNTADEVYQVIRSNSELLQLGDSIYTSTSGFNYIVVGVVGCLPIAIDKVTLSDDNLLACYGDSLESIEIEINDEFNGFGSPWRYSIDNGLSSSDSSIFYKVPVGNYRVVVYDSAGCAQSVDTSFTISQPDELILILKSHENPWEINTKHGHVEVEARGGTPDYTYTLQPGDLEQINNGYFDLSDGDAGIYKITVDDANECGPIAFHFELAVGFETESGIETKVYPNPTSGPITLEMPFEEAEADLQVLNMTGQIVLQRRVYSSGGVINESIDLSNQAKGLYMIRVNGQALQSAIMVQ